jgi:hypothetical protein
MSLRDVQGSMRLRRGSKVLSPLRYESGIAERKAAAQRFKRPAAVQGSKFKRTKGLRPFKVQSVIFVSLVFQIHILKSSIP